MPDHEEWMKRSRAKLSAIRGGESGPRDKTFVATFPLLGSFGRRTCGCVFRYATGRDLTAAVLDWWFARPSGDGPDFMLSDARGALGALWDESVDREIWNHLHGD